MSVTIRRVVTGHDAAGRAKVLIDETAGRTINFRPGCDTALIWTTEGFPIDNQGDADGSQVDIATATGGTVFRIVDFAPGHAPRMHRTLSIDYAVVISGEIAMELEPGEEVILHAGDVLVQRGTIHNWINRGTEVCRIAFVLVGARPVGTPNGPLPAQG